MDKIEKILKSWEEQGKGYIVPFSYGAISQEIRNLYKGDGGGLEREDIKRILTDWHQGEYLQDDAVDKILALTKSLEPQIEGDGSGLLINITDTAQLIRKLNFLTDAESVLKDELQAQASLSIRLIMEWGNEECFEHPYNSKLKYEEYNRKRHRCPECWQSFKGR